VNRWVKGSLVAAILLLSTGEVQAQWRRWRRPYPYPYRYPMFMPYPFMPYPVNTNPPSPPPQQTNSDAPPTDNRAHISIELPTYVTDVWVDDEKMESKIALERLFVTPTLEPGHTYTYTIKVRFVRRGENVTEQRVVHVRANEVTRVSFAAATAAVSTP
jgi:uncharacterized protein (TIGR03000 family)